MFIELNSLMRRQRRHLAVVVAMIGLAGAVVVAHSAMGHDHVGDVGGTVVMCLAVAETAVVVVGIALALGVFMRRALWLLAPQRAPRSRFPRASVGVPARAGPPLLQVFRL